METIQQRRTSAASAGVTKPTGAMSSVFDVPQPPKRKRVLLPPLDLATVKIKSGVPVPPSTTGGDRQSPYAELLARMKVGDCVELSTGHAKSLVSRAKHLGIKVATRTLGEDKTGVWRVK